jgi:hypothetical protein
MMLVQKLSIGVALLCSLAAPTTAQELPKWLVEAKAREAKLGDLTEVSSTDGWLKTKVPGSVASKVTLDDEAYQIGIQLDGSVQVSCEVLKGTKDIARLMSRTSEITFEALQKLHGTIEFKAIEAADAGALEGIPFMTQQWIYRANLNGEKKVGGLKQFVASLDQAVVYCAHDELGFAKTFDTVSKALTRHLTIQGEQVPKTHFRDVSVMSLDDTRVGVATTTMAKDADGDTKVVTVSAMVIQTAPGKLVTQDKYRVEWVRPDGSLINALESKASNGELSAEVALKRTDGRWKVSGSLAGKEIEAELPSAPRSFLEMARDRRQLMAQANPEGAKTEAMAWMSPDFTRLVSVRATLLKPVGSTGFGSREELSGLVMEAVLDKSTGTLISAKMPIAARQLSVDRVFLQGEF